MLRKQKPFLSVLTPVIILAAAIVTLTEFGSIGIAQGQANDTSLTPEQKDAICDPNNPLSNLNPVNTTESKICGIPVTVRPSISSNTTTTGTESPSVVPTPEEG
jgi:hypothetical protein